MDKNKGWKAIFGMVALLVAVTYLQVFIVHWAVGLFYDISMMQAFAIIVLLDMLRLPIMARRVKNA